MKNIHPIIVLLLLTTFNGCVKKDRLLDEYNAFEGTWQWVHTPSQTSIFANWQFILHPGTAGFEAAVEFHDNGTISFYENDELLGNTWYRLLEQSIEPHGMTIKTDFNIKKNGLDLTGDRWFTITNDTLRFTGFPYQGYVRSQDRVNSGVFVRQ